MRVIGYGVTTTLSVKEQATIFQDTAESMFKGVAKLGAGLRRLSGQVPGGQGLNFFTPSSSDDPFDLLDDDKPTFSVGVSIPKFAASGGGNVVVHLYTWDRGDHRETKLQAPYTMGSAGATRKAVDQFAAQLGRHDADAKIAQL